MKLTTDLKIRIFYSLLISLISAASLLFGWATGTALHLVLLFSGVWFIATLVLYVLYKQAKALEDKK